MEQQERTETNLYRRFLNSKAFYPIMLSLIAVLSISIWAVNRSNKLLSTTNTMTQGTNIIADLTDEITTAVQNTTAKNEQTTEKHTAQYETNKAYKGNWILPVSGNIIKDYSAGSLVESKTMGDYRVHNGVDIATKKGETVKAVNSGKVLDVYSDAFWGNTVVIDHGGLIVKYSALSSEEIVSKGNILQKGDKVGLADTVPCEQKDKSHIHIEVLVDNEPVDPLAALNQVNNND